MVKYNPADKVQVTDTLEEDPRESDDDGDGGTCGVDEMLELFGEIKEEGQTFSKPKAYQYLPDHVQVEDGELKLLPKANADTRQEAQEQTLTNLRRKILKQKYNNPTKAVVDIAMDVDCSPSHVTATLDRWHFLIDHPVLFEAFVLRGRKRSDVWQVELPDSTRVNVNTIQKALDYTERLLDEEGDEFLVVSPDGEEFEPLSFLESHRPESFMRREDMTVDDEPSGELSDKCETASPELLQERLDEESADNEELVESYMESDSSSTVEVSLGVTQLSKVLNGLYRDRSEEVAEHILTQLVSE